LASLQLHQRLQGLLQHLQPLLLHLRLLQGLVQRLLPHLRLL